MAPRDIAGKAFVLSRLSAVCVDLQLQAALNRSLVCPRETSFWHGPQDAVAGWEAGDTAPAHSRMSAHKDSTASSRSICTSLASSSGML